MAGILELERLVVRLDMDASRYIKQTQVVERSLESMSRMVGNVGRSITIGLTVPLTAMGATAVREFAKFDRAMTESLAIMKGITPELRKEMEDVAKSLSMMGPNTQTELAKGFYTLGSAGFDAAESMKLLPTVQKFATAGTMELAEASDLLTGSFVALGNKTGNLERDEKGLHEMANALVAVNNLAIGSTEDFANALENKAAAALRLVNKDMYQGLAVLAAYAEQGTQGRLAGSKMEIMLRELDYAARRNADTWEALGAAVYDVRTGEMRPFEDIFRDLERVVSGLPPALKRAQLEVMGFRARSVQAILPLIGMSSTIEEVDDKLRKMSGELEEVYGKQLQSFSNQMQIVKNTIGVLAGEMSQHLAPTLTAIAEAVKSLTEWFRSLESGTQKFVTWALVITAAIGPLVMGLGLAGQAVGTLRKAYKAATGSAVAESAMQVSAYKASQRAGETAARKIAAAQEFASKATVLANEEAGISHDRLRAKSMANTAAVQSASKSLTAARQAEIAAQRQLTLATQSGSAEAIKSAQANVAQTAAIRQSAQARLSASIAARVAFHAEVEAMTAQTQANTLAERSKLANVRATQSQTWADLLHTRAVEADIRASMAQRNQTALRAKATHLAAAATTAQVKANKDLAFSLQLADRASKAQAVATLAAGAATGSRVKATNELIAAQTANAAATAATTGAVALNTQQLNANTQAARSNAAAHRGLAEIPSLGAQTAAAGAVTAAAGETTKTGRPKIIPAATATAANLATQKALAEALKAESQAQKVLNSARASGNPLTVRAAQANMALAQSSTGVVTAQRTLVATTRAANVAQASFSNYQRAYIAEQKKATQATKTFVSNFRKHNEAKQSLRALVDSGNYTSRQLKAAQQKVIHWQEKTTKSHDLMSRRILASNRALAASNQYRAASEAAAMRVTQAATGVDTARLGVLKARINLKLAQITVAEATAMEVLNTAKAAGTAFDIRAAQAQLFLATSTGNVTKANNMLRQSRRALLASEIALMTAQKTGIGVTKAQELVEKRQASVRHWQLRLAKLQTTQELAYSTAKIFGVHTTVNAAAAERVATIQRELHVAVTNKDTAAILKHATALKMETASLWLRDIGIKANIASMGEMTLAGFWMAIQRNAQLLMYSNTVIYSAVGLMNAWSAAARGSAMAAGLFSRTLILLGNTWRSLVGVGQMVITVMKGLDFASFRMMTAGLTLTSMSAALGFGLTAIASLLTLVTAGAASAIAPIALLALKLSTISTIAATVNAAFFALISTFDKQIAAAFRYIVALVQVNATLLATSARALMVGVAMESWQVAMGVAMAVANSFIGVGALLGAKFLALSAAIVRATVPLAAQTKALLFLRTVLIRVRAELGLVYVFIYRNIVAAWADFAGGNAWLLSSLRMTVGTLRTMTAALLASAVAFGVAARNQVANAVAERAALAAKTVSLATTQQQTAWELALATQRQFGTQTTRVNAAALAVRTAAMNADTTAMAVNTAMTVKALVMRTLFVGAIAAAVYVIKQIVAANKEWKKAQEAMTRVQQLSNDVHQRRIQLLNQEIEAQGDAAKKGQMYERAIEQETDKLAGLQKMVNNTREEFKRLATWKRGDIGIFRMFYTTDAQMAEEQLKVLTQEMDDQTRTVQSLTEEAKKYGVVLNTATGKWEAATNPQFSAMQEKMKEDVADLTKNLKDQIFATKMTAQGYTENQIAVLKLAETYPFLDKATVNHMMTMAQEADRTKEIQTRTDDLIKSLKEENIELEAQRLGFEGKEVDLYKYKIDNLTKGLANNIAEMEKLVAIQKEHKLGIEVQKLNDELEKAVTTFGMSSMEVKIWELSQKGAADAVLNHSRALAQQLKQMEEHKKMLEEAEKITEKYRTPMETFTDTQAKLVKMFRAGAISAETFRRAMADAVKELKEGNKEQQKMLEQRKEFPQGLQVGSARGYDFLANMFGYLPSFENMQKKMEFVNRKGGVTTGTERLQTLGMQPGDAFAPDKFERKSNTARNGHENKVETLLEQLVRNTTPPQNSNLPPRNRAPANLSGTPSGRGRRP